MPNININLSVQIEGGPQFNFNPPITIPVEAYDPIKVSIEPGKVTPVEVQPGNRVSFLLIKSSIYTPLGAANDKRLTYQLEGKEAINLDNPQIYLGTASIAALLGEIKKITFSNNLEGDATKDPAVIEILVGRDATLPTPTPSS